MRKRKHFNWQKKTVAGILISVVLGLAGYGAQTLWKRVTTVKATEWVSPVPDNPIIEIERVIYQKEENADTYIDEYAKKYFVERRQQEYAKYLLHCLYWRESRNGLDDGHGDSGKAGGPLQFWQDTWNGYRKIMIERGLITEIGSRYDLEQAIETTAWAISDGRQNAWGPILRGECR